MSIFTRQIRTKTLIEFCHRVGLSLEAGVDIRRTLDREAQNIGGREGDKIKDLAERVSRGESLSEAIVRGGDFFPKLVRKMLPVGEATGRLDQFLLRLSDHYERLRRTRRRILNLVRWPLFQFAMALIVLGVLIWVPEILPRINGKPQDLLGWGMVGTWGLMAYVGILATAFGVIVSVVHAIRQERFGFHRILDVLERLPVVGVTLREMALGRFTWSLAMTTNTPMDLKESLRLAFDAAGLSRFRNAFPTAEALLESGRELNEVLAATGQFPYELISALEVAEQAGTVSESLARQAVLCEEKVERSLESLGTAIYVVIWLAVGTLIVMLIFRLFSQYLQVLSNLGA